MRFTAGDRVTVRGRRWIVEAADAFPDTTLLNLSSAEPSPEPQHCRLLVPFDRPVVADPAYGIRAVRRQRWTRIFHAHLSRQREYGQLSAAERGTFALLPFQLEPALALIQGRASRFLLADEVGLGKTIQAGLMLAELRRRSWCDRALIMTPPGLRRQWADELQQRFDIRSIVIDAAALSQLSGATPYDVNPWTIEPVVITSIDFVKQPEVQRAVAAKPWDLVIVDEAHQASLASLRYEAVQSVAIRARHLVLVTATPHAGHDLAYRALCELGQFDGEEPILLFRRTREQAGLPRRRRAHLLPVRQTPESIEMHRQLGIYLAQLWKISRLSGRDAARLVAMVLAKRAFSSAHSLLQSLERRMAGLDEPADLLSQPSLPLDGDTDAADEPALPGAPAFEEVGDERTALRHLLDAARRAAADERKLHVLRRLVRRVREPVIVFTEYRDTLHAIAAAVGPSRRAALLHGGQTTQERRESLTRFTTGAADLLLATDAGSEGLNLQDRCRLVVNLELPWNPIRLEQRIGRVDRIGQSRTVHAINLFAAGTAEGDVLASLLRRLDHIRMSEIEMAACVIDRSSPPPRPNVEPGNTRTLDMRDAARQEAQRLAGRRKIEVSPAAIPDGMVPVTALKCRPRAAAWKLRGHLVAFMRVRVVTNAGRLVEDALVPVRVVVGGLTCDFRSPRQVRGTAEALLKELRPTLVEAARQHARSREQAIARESAGWVARAIAREHRIAQQASRPEALVQPGLFDNRALQRQAAGRQQHEALRHDTATHCVRLESDLRVSTADAAEVALLLFVC